MSLNRAHAKLHNADDAHDAKVQMRRAVCDELRARGVVRVSVLDLFAGRGEMFSLGWTRADAYVGCDETWEPSDPGRRYCCDNLVLLRSIPLDGFNVFDCDAFGNPWDAIWILAARRRWAPHEIGALVITDGMSRRQLVGRIAWSMSQLSGMPIESPRILDSHEEHRSGRGSFEMLHQASLEGFFRRARVQPRRIWRARGFGSGRGGTRMVYTAVVFEGGA